MARSAYLTFSLVRRVRSSISEVFEAETTQLAIVAELLWAHEVRNDSEQFLALVLRLHAISLILVAPLHDDVPLLSLLCLCTSTLVDLRQASDVARGNAGGTSQQFRKGSTRLIAGPNLVEAPRPGHSGHLVARRGVRSGVRTVLAISSEDWTLEKHTVRGLRRVAEELFPVYEKEVVNSCGSRVARVQ